MESNNQKRMDIIIYRKSRCIESGQDLLGGVILSK